MIRAKNIFKSFDGVPVLSDISTEFLKGTNNLIIGRSGAGKTVLLKLLVGLLQPTQGSIWYDDKDFFSLNKRQLRDLRMQI